MHNKSRGGTRPLMERQKHGTGGTFETFAAQFALDMNLERIGNG
jgi:hypothetical protein